jgi:hypothetical protein
MRQLLIVRRQELLRKSAVEYFKTVFGNHPASNGRYSILKTDDLVENLTRALSK